MASLVVVALKLLGVFASETGACFFVICMHKYILF